MSKYSFHIGRKIERTRDSETSRTQDFTFWETSLFQILAALPSRSLVPINNKFNFVQFSKTSRL